MNDKTPEEALALAKQCGAAVSFGNEVTFQTVGQLQAFAAALTSQQVQPAKQQNQPTNMAPCEVLRNHGKCWRNACVVAGACTAPLVQATKP